MAVRSEEQARAGDGSAAAAADGRGLGPGASPYLPPAQSGLRPTLLRGIVGLIILILAGGLAFTSLRLEHDQTLSALRSSALAAASRDAVYEASYDYHDLNGKGTPWAKLLANSTASFRKRFESTESSLGKVLVQYKATAKANVVAAGLASMSSNRAVVVLFIDQTVSNTVQKSSTVTQPLRVELTMLHEGGRWLVDDVNVPK